MYENDDLKKILLNAIGSHQSLDHKVHLMKALVNVFDDVEKLKELKQFQDEHISDIVDEKEKYKRTLEAIEQYDDYNKTGYGIIKHIRKLAKESLGR